MLEGLLSGCISDINFHFRNFVQNVKFCFVLQVANIQGRRGWGGQRGPWPPLSLRPVVKLEIWYFIGISGLFALGLICMY